MPHLRKPLSLITLAVASETYARTQVWCRKTFQLVRTLREHTGSVLALEYASERDWLFSASGDSTVCVWSTKTLTLLYVLHPYQETGSGDLFSLAWSPSLGTLYIGCQDTSLQWFDFRGLQSVVDSAPGSGTSTPNTRKPHRFFDSYPQHERRPADLFANNSASTSLTNIQLERTEPGQLHKLQVPATNVIDSAHYGYLYCMAILEGDNNASEEIQLVTGSGDETVKVCRFSCERVFFVYKVKSVMDNQINVPSPPTCTHIHLPTRCSLSNCCPW